MVFFVGSPRSDRLCVSCLLKKKKDFFFVERVLGHVECWAAFFCSLGVTLCVSCLHKKEELERVLGDVECWAAFLPK